MYSFYFKLVLLYFIHFSSGTQHYPCNNGPEFLNVTIEGCDHQPCQLVKKTSVKFQVKMLINDYITSLTTDVKAHAMGTDVSYPLPNNNVCSGLIDGECPLDEGEEVTYQLLFPVLDSFPTVPAIVLFTIKSDKAIVGCMKLSVAVVNA